MDVSNLATLTAPAALFFGALVAHGDGGAGALRALRAMRAATVVALAATALVLVLLAARGPTTSPVLGVSGFGFSIAIDGLSVSMLGLVAALGAALLHFSRSYLVGDPRHATFLGDLALTVASVMLLVLSGNLVQLVVMWSITSWALHRLLVFYPERRGAIAAARKKFIVARAGDVCLVAAAVLLAHRFGTGDLRALVARAEEASTGGAVMTEVHVAAMLLVLTAALKAAQFPFHGWLTEMQETPTPVSALLHAGILNGGTFLVVRLAGIVQLSPPAMTALVLIGGVSAVFASAVMITEARVKTAFAYSSAAHMGFMLFLCGIGAYSVAIVHLVAHSFYKAHAFLSSGSTVDAARAARVPRNPRRTGLGAIALAVLAAAVLVGGMGRLFGFSVLGRPTSLALALVLALGLGHLVAQGAQGDPSAKVLGRSVFAAALTSMSFFALEVVGIAVLRRVLPDASTPAKATLFCAAMVLGAFASVIALQAVVPTLASPLAAAAYVHVRNGFYANALVDRVVHAWKLAPTPPLLANDSSESHPLNAVRIPSPSAVRTAVARATKRIAPVWPLERFVAVNPFLGFSDRSFAEAASTIARVAGARTTMPRSFYAEAVATNRIGEVHLRDALAEARARSAVGLPESVAQLHAMLLNEVESATTSPIPTVADVVALRTGTDWSRLVGERIGAWAAAYFDCGQASWRSPWKSMPAFAAWRAEARMDVTPEIFGARGFRRIVSELPADASSAIETAIARLGIAEDALEGYLVRLLYGVGGWSAYARHLAWEDALHDRENDAVAQLLAVRLAWEVALVEAFPDVADAWVRARATLASPTETPALAVDLVLQSAYEKGWQDELLGKLGTAKRTERERDRPSVHAAFCIDVRSEIFRRALEAADPDCETLGFAGFFGFPIEYVPLGAAQGMAQCPVLLSPSATITETVVDGGDAITRDVAARRIVRRRAKNAWRAFKSGAVSCFSFVGPVGLAFAPKLLTDSLGLSRAVPDPARDAIDAGTELGPSLVPRAHAGRDVGLALERRVAMAEGLLRGMSLRSGFARLVLLVGHGSTTVNNPHAAGLDCGACGGHTGEANARVAAAVLNEPAVRAALATRGISVPDDTVFLACLHDTTTDEVRIFDRKDIPQTHSADVSHLETTLIRAGESARRSRAPRLGVRRDEDATRALVARSRDWSNVRPEWGLAGCAAFIVAPRHRTGGLDLGGRAFLHSYDWQKDPSFEILELVMTAPMVVGSWISLQYYASTVDNRVFGCGNKVLHNVVGTVGVLEGNGGDLRVGLPWQSVHDGERFVHEPVRLHVVIEAPIEAMNAVLAKHPSVKALVDNGWTHLYAMGNTGAVTHRYAGNLAWAPVTEAPLDAAA